MTTSSKYSISPTVENINAPILQRNGWSIELKKLNNPVNNLIFYVLTYKKDLLAC